MPRLSRKPLWLAACALLASAACLASFSRPAEGGCGPQQPRFATSSPPTPAAQPVPTAGGDPAPPQPVFRGSTSDAAASPLPPVQPHASPTLEQLLDRLAAVKAQREQLEKMEKALANEIKRKLAEQQQRLKKLGIEKDGPAPTPAQTWDWWNFKHPY